MPSRFVQHVLRLSIEEKILNTGSLVGCICVFFPWVSGEWLGGKNVTYSGLGFFTSFIGLTIVLLHLYILLTTVIPLTGGPEIIKKQSKDGARLFASLIASVLTIAAWSVLTKFTFEFRLQINFGLYGTLIGSLVSGLYSFLQYQESKRGTARELFHHGDNHADKDGAPPPPSSEPEDHRMYS